MNHGCAEIEIAAMGATGVRSASPRAMKHRHAAASILPAATDSTRANIRVAIAPTIAPIRAAGVARISTMRSTSLRPGDTDPSMGSRGANSGAAAGSGVARERGPRAASLNIRQRPRMDVQGLPDRAGGSGVGTTQEIRVVLLIGPSTDRPEQTVPQNSAGIGRARKGTRAPMSVCSKTSLNN